MTAMGDLLPAVDGRDPEAGLVAVVALRLLLDEVETVHVANARAAGWSWEAVARTLGVTRQSVHKKYARRLDGARSRRHR